MDSVFLGCCGTGGHATVGADSGRSGGSTLNPRHDLFTRRPDQGAFFFPSFVLFLKGMQDRVYIENLNEHIGKKVTIAGWVDIRRDHGKLVFMDIRDATGKVQVVVREDALGDAKEARNEWVLQLTGEVKERPEKMAKEGELNGNIEFGANEILVINQSETPPFEINKTTIEVGEETRLKYRYLDLRSERMQKNLRLRGKATKFIRDYLEEKKFVEIETPILTKSTPEGARDFLVPSRLQQGQFYALPQSPQQYKQLLMVAGFERYFQIAHCFRDEDPRADRAYGEFTQLDLEMSFVEQEDILQLAEDLFTTMVTELFPEKHMTQTPWPRLSYKKAMEEHGTDSPDLRKDRDDPNELAFCWVLDFPLFAEQSDDDFFHGSGDAKFAPSHHMFTAPHADDVAILDSEPLKVRGLQHDMVLNGFEVGGGSIRIHDPKVQEKVFDLIGFTAEQKQEFAHMLEAFTYGVPPHGGIAPGIDRILMAMIGEPSLREVMAFPMTGSGQAAIMDAPSEVSKEQLDELGIAMSKKKK